MINKIIPYEFTSFHFWGIITLISITILLLIVTIGIYISRIVNGDIYDGIEHFGFCFLSLLLIIPAICIVNIWFIKGNDNNDIGMYKSYEYEWLIDYDKNIFIDYKTFDQLKSEFNKCNEWYYEYCVNSKYYLGYNSLIDNNWNIILKHIKIVKKISNNYFDLWDKFYKQ